MKGRTGGSMKWEGGGSVKGGVPSWNPPSVNKRVVCVLLECIESPRLVFGFDDLTTPTCFF